MSIQNRQFRLHGEMTNARTRDTALSFHLGQRTPRKSELGLEMSIQKLSSPHMMQSHLTSQHREAGILLSGAPRYHYLILLLKLPVLTLYLVGYDAGSVKPPFGTLEANKRTPYNPLPA